MNTKSNQKAKPKAAPKVREIVSFDYAMKNILRDKANSGILEGFLSELIGRKVKVIAILESEGNVDKLGDKVNRVDIKAQIDNGETAIFEIQYGDQFDFVGKALFNVSKAVVEQVKSGGFYDVKKVYMICIAEFDMGAEREYLFNAKIDDFKGVHFDETLPFAQTRGGKVSSKNKKVLIHPEYYLILPQMFDDEIRGRFDEWVYALKNHTVKSTFKAAGLKEAGIRMDRLRMTEKERKAYDWYLRMRADVNTTYMTYEMKGIEKGLAMREEEVRKKEEEVKKKEEEVRKKDEEIKKQKDEIERLKKQLKTTGA